MTVNFNILVLLTTWEYYTMKRSKLMLAGALALGILPFSSAQAVVVSKTDTVFDSVDNAYALKDLTFSAADFPGDSVVQNVTLTVDFSKCGRSIGANGCTGGTGTPFANEIGFALRAPDGTTVSLVENDSDNEAWETGDYETFDLGSANLDHIVITFDDLGTALGSLPASGTFAPEGSLADFIGISAIGTWTFFYEDNVGLDPLGIYRVTLAIETADANVPEPASLMLMSLGLFGIGYRLRNRKG